MDYSLIPEGFDFGVEIDNTIKVREAGRYNFERAKMRLLELGAKNVVDGQLISAPGLDVEAYEASQQLEFTWEAEHLGGALIRQFQGKKQHHFGDIDQSKLLTIRWISNFSVDTSNADKRAIVSLDFKTGKFTFHNGFVPQFVRNVADEGFVGQNPKLILKFIRRSSVGVSFKEGQVVEETRYNRFLLGWETDAKKVVLCIEPNGYIHTWNK